MLCKGFWAEWHCPGTFPSARCLPPARTGLLPLWQDTAHILLPLYKTVALDFHCYQLEQREESKCKVTIDIFRPMIGALAVKGRWQSAEQHLGVNRTRREKNQVSTQVEIHLVSHSPLSFIFLFFFFFVKDTFLSHSVCSSSNNSRSKVHLNITYHCFIMKPGSQSPVTNLVIKLA